VNLDLTPNADSDDQNQPNSLYDQRDSLESASKRLQMDHSTYKIPYPHRTAFKTLPGSAKNLFPPLVDSAQPKRRTSRRKKNMQYLVLIYEAESRFANGFPESEFAEYGAFGKKYAGAIKSGNALQPTATAKTVRMRDGKTLTTDGPFAETKEQLGGFYLLEAESIEEAASIASGIPAARYGSIEVRPIMIFG
jgi:hypothetical protein